jgi:hypothetical protein
MTKPTEETLMSLVDFAREERMKQKRALCPVCQLSAAVRAQLANAGELGFTRKEQARWLEDVVKVRITSPQLNAHFAGRHDE